MNSAVRKIHNLLSSGAVTVTGPNQPRILKQTQQKSNLNLHDLTQQGRCYVCDEFNNGTTHQKLSELTTSPSNTKFPNKIGQIVGDAFMVIVSVDDIICQRCVLLLNNLDRFEGEVDRIKTNIINLLNKKYDLIENETEAPQASPPLKMQKLNSGGSNATIRRLITGDASRKVSAQTRDPIDNQLSSMFEGETNKPAAVSAVRQINISTPQMAQQQQSSAKKGSIKIYKCVSCDFKTPDLKQFQPHYEKCRLQNAQCKVCKKIFANANIMKQHVQEKHGGVLNQQSQQTNSQNSLFSCSTCHINFTNEDVLKRHMQVNHSIESPNVTTILYNCGHCNYQSTDKRIYDEHVRKHIKVKPFKCRLCSMRFESREQASIHAKTHQQQQMNSASPTYFKCGACSASFTSRDMLVKHFETHNNKPKPKVVQPQQQLQQVQQQIHLEAASAVTTAPLETTLTTQKLLQDTIEEALREPEGSTDPNKIHFFSCNICSLTFIQESYYNSHMETHKRQNKKPTPQHIAGSSVNTTASALSTVSGSITTTPIVSSRIAQSDIKDVPSDIESIFEKMHSEKSDDIAVVTNSTTTSTTTSSSDNKNLVITTQENNVGDITFNITIPSTATTSASEVGTAGNSGISTSIAAKEGENKMGPAVSIDMPCLDQPDEPQVVSNEKSDKKDSLSENIKDNDDSKQSASAPVSMPSLDDDTENVANLSSASETKKQNSEPKEKDANAEGENPEPEVSDSNVEVQQSNEVEEHTEGVEEHEDQQMTPMELDDLQNEGGNIKFIINENGQLLQLDNHILTTDADGNQILVQGTDSEHIQQLLQSVGVLQTGDGLDGETLQMISGDSSGGGQMVLVQQGDNEPQLIDASSLINADGQIIIQQSGDGEGGIEVGEGGQAHVIGEGGVRIPVSVSYSADGQPIIQAMGSAEDHEHMEDENAAAGGEHDSEQTAAVHNSGSNSESNTGGFYALDDLLQPSSSDTSKVSD